MLTSWFADHAWLGGDQAAADVLIEVDGERITAVTPGAQRPAGAVHLPGVTLPGLANAHSHAFHRALRGVTHRGGGSFWTWREDMYAVAAALDPDRLHALARATYAEMVLAGITCVGEFHYVHHSPSGAPYDDPTVMGEALLAAARDAGIRITLLDTCYLRGGFDTPLAGPQLRFGDGDAAAWGERAARLPSSEPGAGGPGARMGAAIHSVRAVPPDQLGAVAAWAAERDAPLHAHLSEQRAENEACLAATGLTPTALLERAGALGPRSSAVHATHLSDADVGLLATSRTTICMCPTTERDLADGIGRARALADAGAPLSLGSDSNAVVDLFEEARGVEHGERLAVQTRGHFRAAELLGAAADDGHASLGWPDAGRLRAGDLADLVTVDLGSVRLAGAQPPALLEQVVFAASAADVREVVVGGRHVVSGGHHALIDDVPGELAASIAAVRS